MTDSNKQFNQAVDDAISFFSVYFKEYSLDELKQITALADNYLKHKKTDDVGLNLLVASYTMLDFKNGYKAHRLEEKDVVSTIKMVVDRILIKPYLDHGLGYQPIIKGYVIEEISKLSQQRYDETQVLLLDIRSKGYLDTLDARTSDLLRPLDHIVDKLVKLETYQKFKPVELCAIVIYEFSTTPRLWAMDFGKIVNIQNNDIPVSGYMGTEEIEKGARVYRALHKLNPAAQYQVFKFVHKTHNLTQDDVQELIIGKLKPLAEILFPDEDVALMRKAMGLVQNAYQGQIDDSGYMLYSAWSDMVKIIWSYRKKFYKALEADDTFFQVDDDVSDTSFTGTIIDAADPQGEVAKEFMDGFKHGLIEHVVPPLTPEKDTVVSPKAWLDNFDRVRADAVKKVIHEVNEILGDPDRLSSFTTYDLARGTVVLHINLQSSVGGILVDVFDALKEAGWESTYSVEGVLTLEAKVPAK